MLLPERSFYREVPDNVKPIPIALVGRSNVGKSSLFNRILSGTKKRARAPVKQKAIVSDRAGTTRDRKEATAVFGGLLLRMIDTGGLESVAATDKSSLLSSMREQVFRAIAEAEAVLFLIDAREGVTPIDREIARMLLHGIERGGFGSDASFYRQRLGFGQPRESVPIILVANKAEGSYLGPYLNDAYELGLGDPVIISAKKAEGMDDLYDRLNMEIGHLQEEEDDEDEEEDEDEDEDEEEGEEGEDGRDEDGEGREREGHEVADEASPSPALRWLPTGPMSEWRRDALRWYAAHPSNPLANLHPAMRELITSQLSRTGRPAERRQLADGLEGAAPIEEEDIAMLSKSWVGAPQQAMPRKEIRDYVLAQRRNEELDKPMRVAVVGLPSAGKSSIINALLQEERCIVDPADGTTMDAIISDWQFKDQPVRLIDTCGVQRGWQHPGTFGNVEPGMGTRRAIRQAHVVIVCVDAVRTSRKTKYSCPSRFEMQLASYAADEGKAVVFAINKWDLIREDEQQMYRDKVLEKIQLKMPDLKGIPVVFMSAKYNLNLSTLMLRSTSIYKCWTARLPTGKLNGWLQAWVLRWPAPWRHGQKCSVKYMTQTRTRPPTFVLWCSTTYAEMPRHYIRQIQNAMRDEFRIGGVPIKFILRTTLMPKPRKKLSKKEVLKWKRMGPKQAEAVKNLNSKRMIRRKRTRQTE